MRPSRNQSLIEALVEIKVRRLELGLSQEDLAGRCELDRPYITLIESGRKQPTISVLHRLAELWSGRLRKCVAASRCATRQWQRDWHNLTCCDG
jgi:predicted transcriptional regulator